MQSPVSRTTVARVLATAAVLGMLLTLLYYLPQPGYGGARLALFVLLAGTTLLAGAGVVTRRPSLTIGGVVGLVLLGFWQFVLGIVVFLAIGCFLLALLVDHEAYSSADSSSSDSSS